MFWPCPCLKPISLANINCRSTDLLSCPSYALPCPLPKRSIQDLRLRTVSSQLRDWTTSIMSVHNTRIHDEITIIVAVVVVGTIKTPPRRHTGCFRDIVSITLLSRFMVVVCYDDDTLCEPHDRSRTCAIQPIRCGAIPSMPRTEQLIAVVVRGYNRIMSARGPVMYICFE